MNKNIFLSAIFLLAIVNCFSQEIKVNSNIFTIDTSTAAHPMLLKTSNNNLSAKPNTLIKEQIWGESGTGSFTTDPLASINISSKQSHQPFLLSTRIYDTNDVPPLTRISFNNMNLVNSGVNTSDTKILSTTAIKIVPSVTEIVPGDPMVFAFAYKTSANRVISNPKNGEPIEDIDSTAKFKLYVFYNDNNTFAPLLQKENLNGLPIPNVRTHNGEEPFFGSAIPSSISKAIGGFKFQNWFYYNIPNNTSLEKTVFVSVMPYANLEIGKSGSIYAILVNENNEIIAKDSILNMRFAPAHDPNYIVQRPFCLKLPKKEYPFQYKIHFQNTGAGDANEVKIIAHLPKGLNYNTFKVKQATFASVDYTSEFINTVSNKNLIIDRIENTIEIIFEGPKKSALLLGTAASQNPSIDEKTMGEILFSLKATPNVDDTLKASADIYFKSVHPSKEAVDGYELPVTTNIAITTYKECCTCEEVAPIPAIQPITPVTPTPGVNGCIKILGLCWWWWIIILIALLIIWWLVSRKKKKKENTTSLKGSEY